MYFLLLFFSLFKLLSIFIDCASNWSVDLPRLIKFCWVWYRLFLRELIIFLAISLDLWPIDGENVNMLLLSLLFLCRDFMLNLSLSLLFCIDLWGVLLKLSSGHTILTILSNSSFSFWLPKSICSLYLKSDLITALFVW